MTLTETQIREIPTLILEKTAGQIAVEYGCHERTINKWVKKLRASGIEVKTRVGRRPIKL
jgi:biotin operon repressor